MKAIIIEDETAAVRNLTVLLTEEAPDIEIVETLDSITEAIEWFTVHPMPDIVFMDIHLADGSAFEIFGHTDISCPIIFTTAYDEYALQAFKVNSIDYLLKPIGRNDMTRALEKLQRLQKNEDSKFHPDIKQLIKTLQPGSYRTHFLIQSKGDKLLPLPVLSVAYIYIQDGMVKAVASTGKEYTLSQTLDEVANSLDPALFFRANRQFLVSKHAIKDIDLWFNNRLSINLHIALNDRIFVSKARGTEFKEWFLGRNQFNF